MRKRRKRKKTQAQPEKKCQEIKVREIVAEDVPWFLEVSERFWKDHKIGELYGEYNRESSERIVGAVLAAPGATIFVATREGKRIGTMMLALSTLMISTRVVAQEIVWWVDPECTGQGVGMSLFDSASKWAKERGAFSFIAASPRGDPKMGQMLLKKGFRLSEAMYLKGL